MLSPSLALEQFSHASGVFKRLPPRQPCLVRNEPVARDAAFYEMVAEIRAHEGEEVDDPPVLFKLVVAAGSAITALAAAGSIQLVSHLL